MQYPVDGQTQEQSFRVITELMQEPMILFHEGDSTKTRLNRAARLFLSLHGFSAENVFILLQKILTNQPRKSKRVVQQFAGPRGNFRLIIRELPQGTHRFLVELTRAA